MTVYMFSWTKNLSNVYLIDSGKCTGWPTAENKKQPSYHQENNESKKNFQQKSLNLIVWISFQGISSGYRLEIILLKDCKLITISNYIED